MDKISWRQWRDLCILKYVRDFLRSHLIMHRTIGLMDYYRTISDGLTG